MMKKQLYLWLSVLVVVLLAVPALMGCAAPAKSPATAPAPAAPAPGGMPQEGIKVHGHWMIDVLNPDGTLVSHQEFDNALTPQYGANVLSRVLGRENSLGGWYVVLSANESANNAFLYSSSPAEGMLVESSYSDTYSNYFKTLTVQLHWTAGLGDAVVLSGTATAQRNGQIDRVTTRVILQASTTPSSSTYVGGTSLCDFSSTALASALILNSGQQIVVTVNISFS